MNLRSATQFITSWTANLDWIGLTTLTCTCKLHQRVYFIGHHWRSGCSIFLANRAGKSSACSDSVINQLSLKCTARSAWMHSKEKKQKNQLTVKCTEITEIYFQEKLLCNFLVKNWKYWAFMLDFGNVNAQFCRNIPEMTRRSLMLTESHIRN